MIAFVLVAIGIVWAVISNILDKSKEDIEAGLSDVKLKIIEEQVYIHMPSKNFVEMRIKREIGKGNLTKIKFIFTDGKSSKTFERDVSMDELGHEVFEFGDLGGFDFNEISIAPIIQLKSGKESLRNVVDRYIVSGGEGDFVPSNDCQSNNDCNDGKICNDGTCISESIDCQNNDDCASGYECVEGNCIEITDDCEGSCGIEQTCEDGVCKNNLGGTCLIDTDCLSGFTCVDGVCGIRSVLIIPNEIASWSFENNANDNRGNYDGTLGDGADKTMPVYTENGKIGGAYEFDGSYDFIETPQVYPYTQAYDSSTFMWIKTGGVEDVGMLITQASGSSYIRMGFFLLENGNLMYKRWGYYWACVSYERSVNDNEWHYVGFTKNKNTAVIAIYIDGVMANSCKGDRWEYQDTTTIIGNYRESDDAFNGIIDEVYIWDKTLSAEQILQNYNDQK